MKSVKTVKELHEAIAACGGGKVGLVPTMGALHEGHLSLVKKARSMADVVVVSVFVNPTQFNDKNDLKNYPRTPEADAALLAGAGADVAFFPSVEEIYPEPDTRQFDFGGVATVMEGACRPGHFNGVAQVVSRLFRLVEPQMAFFGQKDFQQIAVVKAMVKQLALPVQIVECPIVRGKDGLALSSRNALLDAAHRAAAPHIYEVLHAAQAQVAHLSPADLTKWVTAQIDSNPNLHTLYFEAVDALSMQTVQSWDESPRVQGCVAVQAGAIRLIDNIQLK